jgi:hypothetical protein
VKTYQALAVDPQWPKQPLPICDWGCANWSCLDCGSSDGPIVNKANRGVRLGRSEHPSVIEQSPATMPGSVIKPPDSTRREIRHSRYRSPSRPPRSPCTRWCTCCLARTRQRMRPARSHRRGCCCHEPSSGRVRQNVALEFMTR